MINRKIQPELSAIDNIDFVAPHIYTVSDRVNLYHMQDVSDETSRFDLYFDAGKLNATKSIASIVNGLLLSGTPTKNSVQLHEEINALGGFMESGVSAENAVFTVYSLRENLLKIFNIVYDAINNLNFDEKEIEELRTDRIQKYNIAMEQVNTLAQREFQKQLFHSDERYSQIVELDHYEQISKSDLVDFHKKFILNGLERIVVVGNIPKSEIDEIIEKSKTWSLKNDSVKVKELTNNKGTFIAPKDGAMQIAIRIGRTLFNKSHKDYLDFVILNTIVGDYFGSRLMTNIREDKGYTYGIGSMLGELENTGYFLIATEVRADAKEDTIDQIKLELKKLQSELVSNDEIELVKNYMLGQLLKSADGAYAMTDLFVSAALQGKDLEFYNEALESINSITAERLKELALKYFNWDDMTVVIAG